MNVLEKKRGITLIALVITIITILILAGVSINLIIGKNGIVERAQTTGKIQTVASIKEALELEKGDLLVNSKTVNLNNYLDQISNGDKKYEISSKEIIDDKNAEIIINDKYKFLIKDKEKIKELGENSYLLLKKEFDIQDMVRKYKTLYKQLGER